jgi:phenylalanyl-tRNA synthetase alpha chain
MYQKEGNIPESIQAKRLKKYHLNSSHPICQLKNHIYDFFKGFDKIDDLNEVVSTHQNFDSLLIPQNHPARSWNDSYYINENSLLRTQTSSHQTEMMLKGYDKFLVTGDVYRKDTIDKTHYPVFHQMEGVKLMEHGTDVMLDLKNTLSGLVEHLYPNQEYRFLEDSFPFTIESIQCEVKMGENWMEILGAGIIHPQILKNCNIDKTGWAFGLGLDRLVMNFCQIPDIRYMWSDDERFINQFNNGLKIFEPYSKYPETYKDISFYVNDYHENHEELWVEHNNFCENIREIGGDIVESVAVIDKFFNKKLNKTSLMYRIVYRSNDRTLRNEEVNEIQERIIQTSSEIFDIEVRK